MELSDFLAFSSNSNRRGRGRLFLSDRSKDEIGSCFKSMHLLSLWFFVIGRSYRCRAARRRILVLVRLFSGLVVFSSLSYCSVSY